MVNGTCGNITSCNFKNQHYIRGKLSMASENYAATLSETEKESVNEKAESSKFKKIVPLFIAVAALAVVLGIVISSSGYRSVLNKYFSSIEKINGKKYVSIISEYRKVNVCSSKNYSEEEFIELSNQMLEDKVEKLACGDKVRITYEVKDERRLKKTEVEDLEREINTNLNMHDEKSVEITAAIELVLNVTVEGNADDKKYEDAEFFVIKENGKWKLYSAGF